MLRQHSCRDPRSVACGCTNIIERVEQYEHQGTVIGLKLGWVPFVQIEFFKTLTINGSEKSFVHNFSLTQKKVVNPLISLRQLIT